MFTTRNMVLAALFAIMTAVGARLQIPFPGVPMTLQVLLVFLAGMLLGPSGGMLAMILYVVMGLLGLPVFAGGTGGPQILFSPTFGYLLGFILAAWVIGWIVERYGITTLKGYMIACGAGLCAIYLCGTAVLYWNLNVIAGKEITLLGAIQIGVLPFVAVDALKGVAAALVASKIGERLRSFRIREGQ